MEIGVYTFAEMKPDPGTGDTISAQRRIADLMEEIALADQVGLDVFGIGEHHRPDFAVSAPAVILGAAAMVSTRLRLTSSVSVLSSDDPVRVFQDFAIVDLVSGGRAEIMAGRGSFIESFALFGHDLDDYETLFDEKLDLLLKIRANERVTWHGTHRSPLNDLGVYPRPVQNPLPVWVAVGGSPESVIRAGVLGLPMALSILGGEPHHFAPLIELYREAGRRAGHPAEALKVGINSHSYIADSAKQAAEEFFPYYAASKSRTARERGRPPVTREQFDRWISPYGALPIGSPQQVIDKIVVAYEFFRHDRFMAQFSVGTMPHDKIMHAIELLGTKVAPVVRSEVARRVPAQAV